MSTFSITVLVHIAALSLGSAESADSVAPQTPDLAGGQEIIWAIRTRAIENADDQLEICYCPRVGDRLLFRPLPVGRLRGKALQSAAYQDALHVFFKGGGHYRFSVPKRGQTSQTWSPQKQLPGAAIPKALAADEVADCLYAVVDGKTAGLLRIKETDDAEAEPTEEEIDDSIDEAFQSAAAVLVQYSNREWRVVEALPESVSLDGPIHLVAHGEHVSIVAGGLEGRDSVWLHWSKQTAFGVQSLDGVSIDRIASVMVIDKTPVLVVQNTSEDGKPDGYTPWVLTDGQSKTQSPLTIDGKAIGQSADMIRFDRFGSRIIAVGSTPDAGVVAGVWKTDGGDPAIQPETVAILSLSPTAPQSEQLRVLIGAVALVALLSIVFVRRRESFLTDLPTPPGYELASFHRRLIAFTIDALMVQMVAYPVVLAPWFAAHIDMTADFAEMSEQFQITLATDGEEFFWRWMAASAMFVVYGAVCETIFAATVGKLIMGLRVCNDQGKSCSFGAIVARNALRFIELYPAMQFAPTVIFVIMTRNRQRIGDLIARTIVVERSASAPAQQPLPADKSEPNDSESNAH